MQQNYTDIADYFEQLADKHKQIKTFCRYELDELLSKTASIKAFPCLVVEGFAFDFAGSSPDNILKNRHGAFSIVDKCDIFNPAKRCETLERTEIIAGQILSKMVDDKRQRLPLMTSFEINSAEGLNFINPILGYAFCRISFTFKTKIGEDLTVWQ